MRLRALEKRLGDCLETPLIVVRSGEAIDPERLHSTERELLLEFKGRERRRHWLLGRNALKQVLLELDRGDDTAELTFPGSQISLTHGGDIALAAGTSATGLGIGIDYEPLRDIDPRVARWFLDDSESAWLNEQPRHARMNLLVRLWTIKEAAFKSHPDNWSMTFSEFAIGDPAAEITDIVCYGRKIKASSFAFESGYLSVAISGEPW
jgi:4'-phosphopantetheinyl transferase EntD